MHFFQRLSRNWQQGNDLPHFQIIPICQNMGDHRLVGYPAKNGISGKPLSGRRRRNEAILAEGGRREVEPPCSHRLPEGTSRSPCALATEGLLPQAGLLSRRKRARIELIRGGNR
jgi:hypothetical protein